MVSEENTMVKILRDYLICKLYVRTSIGSRNISSLTGISTATIKRAIHLIEEKKEEYLDLLQAEIEITAHNYYKSGVDEKAYPKETHVIRGR